MEVPSDNQDTINCNSVSGINNNKGANMSEYEKLEWLHFAISEAINGNIGELSNALEIVEQLREPHLEELEDEI